MLFRNSQTLLPHSSAFATPAAGPAARVDLCDTPAIAPVLPTAGYVRSPDHTQVLRGTVLWTSFGAKRLDYLSSCSLLTPIRYAARR